MIFANSAFVATIERLVHVKSLDLHAVLEDAGIANAFYEAVKSGKRDCRDLSLYTYLRLSSRLSTDLLTLLLPSFKMEFRRAD